MDIRIAEAKNRLPELIRAVENGEKIVITRRGKAVARLAPAPAVRRAPSLGEMAHRIRFGPGWDDPVDPELLLAGGR